MGNGVFIYRTDSKYQDLPEEQYQFPKKYLKAASACIGNWIVYYEPTKIRATKGYFAVAEIERIEPDLAMPGMFFAYIVPGKFIQFANPVPFKGADDTVIERGLLNEAGGMSGRKQSAVRTISPQDFQRILRAASGEAAPLLPRLGDSLQLVGLQEEQAPFVFDQPRERRTLLTSRAERKDNFRRMILRAYDERCAISGLKFINGGGRAEVEAAHIRPVEANGPDTVRNGLALSGTAHWMFDRGLISLSDQLEILVSRHSNNPDEIRAFINKSGRAIAPEKPSERPHPHFLQWHRENCFKH